MKDTLSQAAFENLQTAWVNAGVIPPDARWIPFGGGRSNPIWHIQTNVAADLVCKLYLPNTATPLFANDGKREALALRALDGLKIAPPIVSFQSFGFGDSLIYQHIAGEAWRGEIGSIAELMARLHQRPLPQGLPEQPTTAASLLADGNALVRATQKRLPPPPSVTDIPDGTRVFLHGDIVPGNILVTANGLRLIDWQCPAIGDPCADIAVFLSPAMQTVYGHRALTGNEVDEFLSVYEAASGDGRSVERYRRLAALFHWRMAAYCLWKAARGDADYNAAAELELAALEQR